MLLSSGSFDLSPGPAGDAGALVQSLVRSVGEFDGPAAEFAASPGVDPCFLVRTDTLAIEDVDQAEVTEAWDIACAAAERCNAWRSSVGEPVAESIALNAAPVFAADAVFIAVASDSGEPPPQPREGLTESFPYDDSAVDYDFGDIVIHGIH